MKVGNTVNLGRGATVLTSEVTKAQIKLAEKFIGAKGKITALLPSNRARVEFEGKGSLKCPLHWLKPV